MFEGLEAELSILYIRYQTYELGSQTISKASALLHAYLAFGALVHFVSNHIDESTLTTMFCHVQDISLQISEGFFVGYVVHEDNGLRGFEVIRNQSSIFLLPRRINYL
jgi:hypothetical protein